jgi:ATP-dependent DNA helicase RecQ
LAGILKQPVDDLKKQLELLEQQGIILYGQQREGPQLYFLRPRIRAEDLKIDSRLYELRKEKFRLRTGKMIAYIKERKECRSQFIGRYFGDRNMKPCGVCDHCLATKNELNRQEFETLNHRILNTVKYEPLPARELLLKLSDIKKEKAWKVLEFLQAENKIEMDDKGWVKLK